MNYIKDLIDIIKNYFLEFNLELLENDLELTKTKKNFEGDISLPIFKISSKLKKKPSEIGKLLGEHIINESNLIINYNVISGFLNLNLSNEAYLNILKHLDKKIAFSKKNKLIIFEYPGPNTNKPLHLGHLRNMFIGKSVSNIYEICGYDVKRVNIVNDRGIHICKSMVAYMEFGQNDTPKNSKLKGDHFVGKYYVLFDKKYKEEILDLMDRGNDRNEAEQTAPIFLKVKKVLKDWENGKKNIIHLWKKMNNWVYDGFDQTYKKLDITFDKTYYESETYLYGKGKVLQYLKEGIFYQNTDSSIWIDLEKEGLGQKLLLRKDGTSVYMTQDIGTAELRYLDYKFDKFIYVVGNEQEYHFQTLFEILKKIKTPYANNLYHLSYGMVNLPSGKMKSREGTVVDADDLINEMIENVSAYSLQYKNDTEIEDKISHYTSIALAAIRYYFMKVDPQKNIIFDPKASIDLQGDTGPFLQYTHARISSLLDKALKFEYKPNIKIINFENYKLTKIEKDILLLLSEFYDILKKCIYKISPTPLANYIYDLAKTYNRFYAELEIINAEENSRNIRLSISYLAKKYLSFSLKALDIDPLEKM